MTKTLCIYHANCADGLGAAWAVHRALGEEVEFVAASYGDDPRDLSKVEAQELERLANMGRSGDLPNQAFARLSELEKKAWSRVAGRDILIVDFSYPLATLRAMAADGVGPTHWMPLPEPPR